MLTTDEGFPDHYEDPGTFYWDADKMSQALGILGFDPRRADGIISFSINTKEVIIERASGINGGTVRKIIPFGYVE